jgi:hypothetical protein
MLTNMHIATPACIKPSLDEIAFRCQCLYFTCCRRHDFVHSLKRVHGGRVLQQGAFRAHYHIAANAEKIELVIRVFDAKLCRVQTQARAPPQHASTRVALKFLHCHEGVAYGGSLPGVHRNTELAQEFRAQFAIVRSVGVIADALIAASSLAAACELVLIQHVKNHEIVHELFIPNVFSTHGAPASRALVLGQITSTGSADRVKTW